MLRRRRRLEVLLVMGNSGSALSILKSGVGLCVPWASGLELLKSELFR